MKRLTLILLSLILFLIPLNAQAIVRNVQDNHRFAFTFEDADGDPITGETITLLILRASDGYYFDFDDSTFKASGWTTKTVNLTEDSTAGQEQYYYSFDPPASETGAEQYEFIIDDASASNGLHISETISYQSIPLGTSYTVARAGYIDALNGHTAQTGDSYAIVNSGTYGNSALKTLIDAVPTVTEIQTEIEENGASVLDSISDKLPTNYIMGSAVQTDKDDDIDEILTDTATTIPGTITTMQADLDNPAQYKAAGFSTHSASNVWAVATRSLTILDEDSTTIDLDGSAVGSLTTTDKDGYTLSASGVDAFWDEIISGHTTVGSFGKVLSDDIVLILEDTATTIPATITTAQADLDNPAQYKADVSNLDAAVSSRSTLTAANVWETNISAYSGAGYAGTYIKNLYDNQGNWITAAGFSTHAAADIWSVATRSLTILDEDSTTIDLDASNVGGLTTWSKTGYSLSASGIDSIWDEVITGHSTGDSFGKVFDDQIDGLRTYGDTNWATAAATSTLTAQQVWAYTTRKLTHFDEDDMTIDLDSTTVSATATVSTSDKQSIADYVWDEVLADHLTAGTTGNKLNLMPSPYIVGP